MLIVNIPLIDKHHQNGDADRVQASPLVSAIILNYRTGLQAVRCVKALSASDHKNELLLVDNHSNDDSIGILRTRLGDVPSLHILETPRNLGFGLGYNLGIRQAKGKYLLINNPAKVLDPGNVEKMVQAMEADPSIGILGPKLRYEDGTVRDSYRTFPTFIDLIIKRTFLRRWFPGRMRRYLQWGTNPDEMRDVDWVIGGCLLMRADLAEQLGGFDPRFYIFFEDMDLCRRCWKAGKRVVYFPAATGTDRKRRLSEGSSFTILFKKIGRIHVMSALKYFHKWGWSAPAGRS